MWWLSLVSAEEIVSEVDNIEMSEVEQQAERIESLQLRVQKWKKR